MVEFTHKIVSQDVVDGASVSFNVRDNRGREVGYHWTLYKVTTQVLGESGAGHCGYVFGWDATVHYRASTHVTRNDRAYGASVSDIRGLNLDLVRTKMEKRIRDSQTSYVKRFGER